MNSSNYADSRVQAPGPGDPAGTFQPPGMAEGPVSQPVAGRVVRLTLAVLLGALAGFGVQQGVDFWRARQQAETQDFVARPAYQLAQAPVLARFKTWLIIGERLISLQDGQVALPGGSRFALRVESPAAGTLSVLALNPKGEPLEPALWSGRVSASQVITTDTLRLEGEKGRETLIIRLVPRNETAAVTSQRVHLWHL